ncbi:MAG: CDP-diacylglycerol--glycerol-3-phosphate 3-phosphatidyltransferase [Clostridia bacterium]|nr:CDP-diacylglycerol--glycerol-3-phosphate 3-phosphatidyltransferase [Clostridia bacterium]
MNIANKLTVLRVILTPIFLLLFLIEFPFHYIASLAVFGLAAYTDLLDGKLARERNLITNLGKFLDPIADKMLTTAAFLGFLAIGRMNVWALMIVLIREFMVTSVRLMAAEGGKVVAANGWGKAKTVAQYVAIIYVLTALEWSTWGSGLLSQLGWADLVFTLPVDLGAVPIWVATILTAISGIVYFWDNRSFFLEGDR